VGECGNGGQGSSMPQIGVFLASGTHEHSLCYHPISLGSFCYIMGIVIVLVGVWFVHRRP
jgi:hypothetical protein